MDQTPEEMLKAYVDSRKFSSAAEIMGAMQEGRTGLLPGNFKAGDGHVGHMPAAVVIDIHCV